MAKKDKSQGKEKVRDKGDKFNESQKGAKPEEKKKKFELKEGEELVRILGKDVRASMKILPGLAKVKGISWAFANAVVKKMGLDKETRIKDLSKEEIEKINAFVKNPDLPNFLKNRQNDFDSGDDVHLQGSDLDLRKDFDIKRLKKVKAYRGVRHGAGLPVRGQRTKSNFRKNRKKSGAVGVKGKGKR